MKQNLFEEMNFKDLYILRKPLRTKNGKEVKPDTPIRDIEGIDFDDFGNIVSLDLTPPPKEDEEISYEWYETQGDIEERKECKDYYNGHTESEIFGCKDNEYMEDDEEHEEMGS